jgi:hypothetical protein
MALDSRAAIRYRLSVRVLHEQLSAIQSSLLIGISPERFRAARRRAP